MSKKKTILLLLLVAVVLLTLGGAATVLAQGEAAAPEVTTKHHLVTRTGPRTEPCKSSGFTGDNMTAGLQARVAEILGISQESLASALKQAQQEMREDAFLRVLDKTVEKGRLTRVEADEKKEWWQQKSEALGAGIHPPFFNATALNGRHMWGSHKFMALVSRHVWGGPKGWHSDNTT